MGQLKQLLPFGNRTVLEQCVENFRLAGVEPIVVVLGFEAERIRSELEVLFGKPYVHPVVNERHAEGMLTSVQCGVRAADALGIEGFLLGLVDQPFLSPELIGRVLSAFRATEKPIVVPQYREKRGHPIALSMELRDEVLALEGENVGLRDLIRARKDDTLLLPFDTGEILRDMDSPDEYLRELERLEQWDCTKSTKLRSRDVTPAGRWRPSSRRDSGR